MRLKSHESQNGAQMTNIIGVDFSGARDDRNTWATCGRLCSDGTLVIQTAEPVRRDDLYALLSEAQTPAVAALDFPFGVPKGFASFVTTPQRALTMTDVWSAVERCSQPEFIGKRDEFVAKFGETKRVGDEKYHPESFSPLHKVNPNMVPMTYHGIRMLHALHEAYPRRWHVPPMEPGAESDRTVTLLELMPGAFLKAIGLPYKGFKKGRDAYTLRRRILGHLSDASGVPLPNLGDVREVCIAEHDCLDSVVAAVGAAAWVSKLGSFKCPTDSELADASLEGWIYVPGAAG